MRHVRIVVAHVAADAAATGLPSGWGEQALTGIFPCSYTGCGLVRLRHTADLSLLYDDQYGYRSGIRPFMINHLHSKVDELTKLVDINNVVMLART
ncbi:hypothetical protein [Streptomyces sp. CS113]|uniref:hypothetical protein n=1 Tax=Streptomyces sp. CS113 TaxID=1982761 RepID=UPI000B41C6AB|nr:hypothetical protein [Streptomyces sp. CS113]